MRIRWTEQAVEDLAGIKAYIARDSAVLAQLVATRLYAAVDQLPAFPDSGRVVPERADLRCASWSGRPIASSTSVPPTTSPC